MRFRHVETYSVYIYTYITHIIPTKLLRDGRKVREHELEVVRLAMLEALDSEGLLPKDP